MKKYTWFVWVNETLHTLITEIKNTLRENLIWIYLQGSLAVWDFDENSDIDFIIIIQKDLNKNEIRELNNIHNNIYNDTWHWWKHLEWSYITKETIGSVDTVWENVWYVDHWSTVLERSDHCNSLLVRWVLYEKWITLFWPEPQTLIKRVETKILKKEIFHVMHEWWNYILKHPAEYNNIFYQTYLVLSYCRMLYDLKHGSNNSKRTWAEWAKDNLDPSWKDLIDRSWKGRIKPEITSKTPANPEDYKQTLKFLRYILKESQKYFKDETLD